MKRFTTAMVSLWLAGSLQMTAAVNYNASKSNTGNFVITAGQPRSLMRYSADGRLINTIAGVPGAIAVAKDTFGNYMVLTASPAGSALVQVTPTGVVSPIANAPSGASWVSIASDQLGSLIAVSNTDHAVYRVTVHRGQQGLQISVTKLATYAVANASEPEDAVIAVDAPSGNYFVVEDNGGSLHELSVTPAGTVTPISPSGATATSCRTSLVPYGTGTYLFVSPSDNAIFTLTTAGVVTQVAGNVAPAGILTSAAVDPQTGDFYASTSTGPIMHISADGSFIDQVANVPMAANMIAETYGSLPHLAAGDVWTTGFYVLNPGNQPASYSVSFFDEGGNLVALPFSSGSASVLQGTLPAQGMTYIEAANPGGPLVVASGLISADSTVTVQALFREHSIDGNYYEAGVPASAGGTGFTMPFDATTFAATGAPVFTGFAVANLDPVNAATVTCTATDQTGATIPNAVPLPQLSPLGKYANYNFPALTGKRGMLQCSSNTRIAALGLRFLGADAFSSLPVLY
jgi:hypothetical protein